ncbi:MAG: DUF362 domain-containing protein [Deferrisomatales bacterium]|nr:DUF362 domain-containing protein [Deferrisomatales bacterium]
MKVSEVFYADLRTSPRKSLLDKVEELLHASGAPARVKRGDLVAVKLHFGEKGNTAFLRPIFVRRVVDVLKGLGAKPFLTDTNTLYVGSRGQAVSHLETAIQNGFDYAVVGAPLIIADGLRGSTSVRVDIGGKRLTHVLLGAEIAHADAVVGLAHFKGHELSGFGGCLKNLGMGCAAREGKLAQHSTVAPKVKKKLCVACGECVRWCAQGAIAVGEVAFIDTERCVGCGECILTCPEGAIQIQWNEGPEAMQEKMAEHALGVLKDKRHKSLFLNFATQVSPACDCYGHNDAPIVGDVGILSSTDPVALDQACVDLVNAKPGNEGTALATNRAPGEDKFRGVYPKIDWSVQLRHAEEIGLGSRTYRLRNIGTPGG